MSIFYWLQGGLCWTIANSCSGTACWFWVSYRMKRRLRSWTNGLINDCRTLTSTVAGVKLFGMCFLFLRGQKQSILGSAGWTSYKSIILQRHVTQVLLMASLILSWLCQWGLVSCLAPKIAWQTVLLSPHFYNLYDKSLSFTYCSKLHRLVKIISYVSPELYFPRLTWVVEDTVRIFASITTLKGICQHQAKD